MNTDIESLIWMMGEYEPEEDELRQMTDYIIKRLSTFLKQEVEIHETCIDPGNSATYFIYSSNKINDIFEIEWKGVVIVQSSNSKPWVDAQLLLFSRQQRFGLQEHEGKSVMVFRYERDMYLNTGEWRFFKWEKDFYGEWESYVKLNKPNTKSRIIKSNN